MNSWIFTFLTIMLCTTLGTSLKCYSCNRRTCQSGVFTNVDCNAQTGNPLVDSVKSLITPQCMKIEGIDASGNHFQERNCTANFGPAGCSLLVNSITMSEKARDVQCYVCDSNYCNSGIKVISTLSIFFSSVLFLL